MISAYSLFTFLLPVPHLPIPTVNASFLHVYSAMGAYTSKVKVLLHHTKQRTIMLRHVFPSIFGCAALSNEDCGGSVVKEAVLVTGWQFKS